MENGVLVACVAKVDQPWEGRGAAPGGHRSATAVEPHAVSRGDLVFADAPRAASSRTPLALVCATSPAFPPILGESSSPKTALFYISLM